MWVPEVKVILPFPTMPSRTVIDASTALGPTLAVLADAFTSSPSDKQLRSARAVAYPIRAWYCIGSFIGFVSLCYFLGLAYRIRRKVLPSTTSRQRGVIDYRRLPVAVMHTFRAFAFRSTVSIGRSYTLNVAELFMTAAYAAILFSWGLVNTTSTTGVRFDARYWANRTGNIAAAQLPLMTALGMKNNLISFLTGVSFDKLNYLHRMTARVLCALTWLHAAGRIHLGLVRGTALSNAWVQCGILAGTSLTVLSIASIRPVRNRGYRFFFVLHFFLSFIFLMGAYFHAQTETSMGYYVWPSLLLMGLDRVLRVLRIVVFNFGYFKFNKSTELDAHIDVLSPDFLRITLQRPDYMHWAPGQSAYISFPAVSAFESHPFTISTIDVPRVGLETSATDGEKSPSKESIRGYKKLVFLVRVQGGFTQRLRNAAQDHRIFKVFLDGPYSSPPLLRGFDTAIFISGGSGVAFTLPLLLDLVHRAQSGHSTCRKIIFVWAIRNSAHVEWISDALLPIVQNVPSSITIDIRLFITRAQIEDAQPWDNNPTEDDIEEADKEENTSESQLFSSSIVHVQKNRPDLKGLLKDEIARATGDIAVNVCGTASLASSVRSALRDPRPMDILKGGPAVTLHVEAFNI